MPKSFAFFFKEKERGLAKPFVESWLTLRKLCVVVVVERQNFRAKLHRQLREGGTR